MISIDKLKLFPFHTKDLAIPTNLDEKFNILFYPENSNFSDSYFKLNIKKQFVRHATIFSNKIPRVVVTGSTIKYLRELKLIPVIAKEKQLISINTYIDLSLFLNSLDNKFGTGNYGRQIVTNSLHNQIANIKQISKNKKNVFMYYVDMTEQFNVNIRKRRIFAALSLMHKLKTTTLFDYFIVASNDGGLISYTALTTPEKQLPLSRIFNLFRSAKPLSGEEIKLIKGAEARDAVTKVTESASRYDSDHISQKNKEKLNLFLKKYLKINSSKIDKLLYDTDITKEFHRDIALKSIIYNLSGDNYKTERIINNMNSDQRKRLFDSYKKDLLPEIIDEDSFKNTADDAVFKNALVHEINDYQNPSKVINKRSIDFKTTFEKDLINSFKMLSNEKYPMKISSVKSEMIPIEDGDLNPTKNIKYTFILTGPNNKKHPIEIIIPAIQEDGTFIINGKKKFLIYQNILDPIYFIKLGQAKLETLYAAISIHHKHTAHKSYYDIYIGGYKLPIFSLLCLYIGFKKTMEMFKIRYKLSENAPPEDSKYIELSDNQFVWIDYDENDVTAQRIFDSFKEIHYKFDSSTIFEARSYQLAIESMLRNRNSAFRINKVLHNIMEPVAVQVLKTKLLPTTLEGCIYYICTELSKGRVDKRHSLSHQRVRSSEVFAYQIQKAILSAYTNFEFKYATGDTKAEYKCDTSKIVSDIINSELVRDLENINPVEELSSMTRITPVGAGGIPDGNALTNESRGLDPTFYGNIDPMDTPEGDSIGMINQLTIGAAINNARGSFLDHTKSDLKAGTLSPTSVLLPFVGSCDGNRVQFSASQGKQAIPIKGIEQPMVQTGYETIMTSMLSDAYVKTSPSDGIITNITDNSITIKSKTGKYSKISLDPKVLVSNQGQNSLNIFSPNVRINSKIKKGQIVASGSHVKNGVISMGTNLLVGLMGWKGYSFEDGYIISDKLAESKLQSDAYDEIAIFLKKGDLVKYINEEGADTIKGDPLLVRSTKDIETLIGIEEDELVEGQLIKKSPGGKIISIEIYPNMSINSYPKLKKQFEIFKKKYEETKGSFPKKFLYSNKGKKEYFQGIKIVFKILRTESTILGDKLTNHHGGKGVITYIEKLENMPVTPWGEPLDILFNPIAIINRMNPSTIYEMYTGLIAKFLARYVTSNSRPKALKMIQSIYTTLDVTEYKKMSKSIIKGFISLNSRQWALYMEQIKMNNYVLPIIIPPFQAPTKELIFKAMHLIGAESGYNLKLPEYNTRTKYKVACGYLYYKKLEQQSEYKIAARSTGKYQEGNMQPTAGKKSGGGQRLGEFDTWCFADRGANNILKEFFGPMSDDQITKGEIISDIIQHGNAEYREPKRSPTRNLLDIYIKGLMLKTSINESKVRK